ncbi:MAG: ABC transporter permease [Verrucomicrobiales bacterium]|nr:ABC transporter permease [Verrucomicrobiales bacterium]
MNWLRKFRFRLRALSKRQELDAELDEELRAHVEMQTAENVELGMPPGEARSTALHEFGWVEKIKETAREERGVRWIEDFLQDLRHGFRLLFKNPAFTTVAVLTLALGIGANTTIFSLVNGVLLRPLSYPEADRIVNVYERNPRLGFDTANVAPADFVDWQEQNTVFETLAFVGEFAAGRSFILTGGDVAERLRGRFVSASFFSVFRTEPMLGRTFLPEEDKPGGNLAVVLGHGLWQRVFAGNSNIVGQTVTLDNNNRRRSYAVVGVMPPGFGHPPNTGLWVSASGISNFPMNRRPGRFLNVVGRLKPNVSLEQAQAAMDLIQGRIEQKFPNLQLGSHTKLVPLREQFVGGVRQALLVFLGAVGFVLLIACANVANLLLARASSRQREMAIRTALGASRLRIVRQLLTESTVLALMGLVLGILVAYWSVHLLPSLGAGVPRINEVKIDGRVLSFSAVLAFFTGIIFGLAPALQSSKADVNEALKSGSLTSGTGREKQRLRGLLVVSEIALALILLIGAGLMIQSFVRLQRESAGFNAENLLVTDIDMGTSSYPNEQTRRAFFSDLVERMKSVPGVQSVCGTAMVPMVGTGWSVRFQIDGQPRWAPEERPQVDLRVITPGYFRTLGIQLLKGRDFVAADTAESIRVVVVNEALARRYFPNDDPLGKHLELDEGRCEIIAVAADVKNAGLPGEVKPEIYGNYLQWYFPSAYLVLRTASDPMSFAPLVRSEVRALNKDQPVAWTFVMQRWIAGGLNQPRFRSLLLGTFGGVALVLAAVGIYGVMAFSVAQRTHEIGVRMALGAQRSDVLKLILGQGLKLALWGVIIGLAGSFALTRFIATQLFGVTSTDPLTFAGISLLLVLLVLAACLVPARRGMKVEPMLALRYE